MHIINGFARRIFFSQFTEYEKVNKCAQKEYKSEFKYNISYKIINM